MPTFTTERRVPFTAAQMYALVADVERYPEFLPLCTGLTVTSRSTVGTDETLIAKMSVGYKSIKENFTTNVTLHPAQHRIEARYLDGPFRHLENRWRFIDVGDATSGLPSQSIVDFYITYEFKSALLGVMVGAMFEQAFRKFAEAFEQRAGLVYGRPTVPSV